MEKIRELKKIFARLGSIKVAHWATSLFAVVTLPLVFYIPLFQAADEINHFYRALELSQGHLFSEVVHPNQWGREFPTAIYDTFRSLPYKINLGTDKITTSDYFNGLSEPWDVSNTTFVSFPNTALNSPLSYHAQTVGVFLANHLGLHFKLWPFCGRLTAWIYWIFVLYYALKVSGRFGVLLAVFSMTPLVVFQSVTFSSDSMIFASVILFAALTYRAWNPSLNFNKTHSLAYFIALILLVGSKSIFTPMIGVYFLTESKRIYSNPHHSHQYRLLRSMVQPLLGAGILLIAVMAWNHYIFSHFVPFNSNVVIDPPGQINWIKSNPLVMWKHIVDRVNQDTKDKWYLSLLFGGVVGWNSVWLDLKSVRNLARLVFWIVVTFSGTHRYLDNFKGLFSLRSFYILAERGLIMLFTMGSCLSILLGLYISWNPVGFDGLEGTQPRYFAALLPMAFLALRGLIPLPRMINYLLLLVILAQESEIVINLYTAIQATYYR